MYQPSHGRFTVPDAAALLGELAAAVPATLITLGSDGLRVSVLPMLFEPDEGDHGVLRGHVARPNPQWRDIDAHVEALAIFDGPEAYVTPAWYEEKQRTGKVVPTWNYTVVVARGPVAVHHDGDWLLAHVRRLVNRHEAGRDEPWSLDDTPPGYAETQVKAIVGIELRIAGIEAKRKLSQNRSETDVAGVIMGLSDGSPREREVAAQMRDLPRRR